MSIPPGTTRRLLLSLCEFVEDSIRSYPFPSPEGDLQTTRVFLHGLPEEQESISFPFVIIRFTDGEISSEADGQSILRDTVLLALGVYAPRDQRQAGLLCAEMLDCLRRAFWRKRLLAETYELVEPLRISCPDPVRQAHRYHWATLETVWNYAWPPKALDNAVISAMCGANPTILN